MKLSGPLTVTLIFASYLFGLVHETLKVRVLPLTASPDDLQSLSGVCCDRLFMSFTISGVKQTVCFCGIPVSVISHSPGRICGPALRERGRGGDDSGGGEDKAGRHGGSGGFGMPLSLGAIPRTRNRGIAPVS